MKKYTNSIRKKYRRILIAAILITVILSMLFQLIINYKTKNLLANRLNEYAVQINEKIKGITNPQKSYVEENTFWDELVKAYQIKDTTWIKETFVNGMTKNKIDYLWFLEDNLQEFKNYQNMENNVKIPALNFTKNKEKSYLDLLNTNPFQSFYNAINNSIVQIHFAPLHPSKDVERKTKALGYVAVGIVINNTFLNNGKKEMDSINITLCDKNEGNTTNAKSSKVIVYEPLKDYEGKTIKWIRAEKYYPDLKLYRMDVFTYSIASLIIIGLILLGFYYYTIINIDKPITQLVNSLHGKDIAKLNALYSRSDEFSELADLVNNSYLYQIKLEKEIEVRIKSENELYKALQEVEQKTSEKKVAEMATIAKSEFLSTMSHEIRTPINGVIGIVNLMKDEQLSERQREYINVLDFSSKHLLSIVSDILDFSKIETGKMEFEKNSFDIYTTCLNIYNLFKPRAQEKMIEFNFLSDNNNIFIYGDNVRLNQVLANLIGNAIKFTNIGTVSFGYNILSNNANHITYSFFIEDTGIGIEEKKLDTIFESFSQANAKITREYGGTGLGLTITKKLLEMQGGSIKVESTPGKGSIFTFYITYEKHAFVSSLPKQVQKIDIDNNLQGMKILVAEDNKINTFVLKQFLTKWGVDAKFAITGLEALDLIEDKNYDMVLMDLQMPVMDGQQATTQIRKSNNPKIKSIPIVALTADASLSTQELLLQNGFDYFITKPFNPDTLYRILKKHYEII